MPVSPVRVLCVDDDDQMRSVVGRFLSRHSDIEVVGGIRSALELRAAVFDLQPHVVLMDLGMDGPDPLREMKEILDDGHSARFIILSGTNSREVVDQATRYGAAAFVDKIGEPAVLLATVRRVAADLV